MNTFLLWGRGGGAFDYYIGTPLPKVLQALWEVLHIGYMHIPLR